LESLNGRDHLGDMIVDWDNIKIVLRKIWREGVDWIQADQNRVK
jgi:hypothetical protein